MSRSKSSQRWLKRHFADPFVKKAKAEGFRSRAAYKLDELLSRPCLVRPGMTIIELGAAPGGWSQQVRRLLGHHGRVIALDRLPMSPVPGVEFLQGDFQDEDVQLAMIQRLAGQAIDLVLCDMAPNTTGVRDVDQARMMLLAEMVREFADRYLSAGGVFLIKLFQGSGFDDYIRSLRSRYAKVVIRKPSASRRNSPEVYAVCQTKCVQPNQ